jgi:hypothetical protein
MVTRFSVQPDERRVLIGVDKANIFEAGVVYEAVKIMDEIILKPVGKYSLNEKGYPSENSTVDVIMHSGLHLVTKEEQELAQTNAL